MLPGNQGTNYDLSFFNFFIKVKYSLYING